MVIGILTISVVSGFFVGNSPKGIYFYEINNINIHKS